MLNYLSFSQTAMAALLLLLMAGFWGCPIIAILSELAGKITKKIFLDKFALQITRLSILLHAGLWLGCLTLGLILWYRYPGLFTLAQPWMRYILPIFGLALAGTLLLMVSLATWNRLKKKKKILHIAIGLMGVLLLKPLFWCPVLLLRNLALEKAGQTVHLFPPLHSMFWPVGMQWVFTAISLAAVLGSLYLLVRRQHDDFGRDYYNYALPVCAKWALFPFAGVVVFCSWIAFLAFPFIELTNNTPLFAAMGIRGTSLLSCVIIWIVIMKTPTPLRYKGMILTSILLAWTFLMGSILTFYEILGNYTGFYTPHSFLEPLLTSWGLS